MTKRILTWGGFIIIVGLIVWGMIAAQQKQDRQDAALVLPTQIVATDHVRGNDAAPVTLVEYGDFQCPACGAYYPLVEKLLAAEGSSTVRYVFRHFPLSQHPNAVPAASAAEAAGNQGKFWEMYNLLYSKQDDWVGSTDAKTIFTGYAKSLNLNIAQFTTDYDSQAVKDTINADYEGGVKAGINATPTFFINGTQAQNINSYEDFKKAIDDAVPKLQSK